MDAFLDGIQWLTDSANWQGEDGVANRMVEHLWITLLAIVIACAIAIPVALWLGHIGKGGTFAINTSNVGRAIPTYALLVVLFLATNERVGSTVVALVLFAIPPILTNTYVGMREVDRDAVDAANGMGMGALQVLRRVELPLAVPLVMNGLRLAVVQVFATATIAALVGGPGLGRIITSGFARQDLPKIVAGAIVVGLLALLLEGVMEFLQRRFDPVRRARRYSRRDIETQIREETVSAT